MDRSRHQRVIQLPPGVGRAETLLKLSPEGTTSDNRRTETQRLAEFGPRMLIVMEIVARTHEGAPRTSAGY